ncbi:MAG: hypothetical protein HYR88_05960, partial [Verrucomicrobia bacterium]|nr:hypothetical protein [Verrucomicrobiota bacterium]
MKAKRRLIGIAIAACAISLFSDPADAAITGQWDFKGGNLQATIGQDMDYLDGDTQARTAFGTTTSFGIPDIGGVAVKVMKFPAAADEFGGYFVPIGAAPNGGGGNVNQYTVIMDVFYPSASSDKVRTLFVSDVNAGSAKLAQRGEVYLDSNNSIVLSEGAGEGTVTAGAWHRIAIAVDATSATSTTVKYIDGVKAGELKTPRGGIDGKFSVYSALNLFNDLETNSQSGFIASLQFQDEKLTDGLLGALGAPVPGGILTTAPPTPYVESLSPSSDLRFPGRSTIVPNPHIEIVLTDGITAVDPTTVKLSINKKSVVPTVNRSAPT